MSHLISEPLIITGSTFIFYLLFCCFNLLSCFFAWLLCGGGAAECLTSLADPLVELLVQLVESVAGQVVSLAAGPCTSLASQLRALIGSNWLDGCRGFYHHNGAVIGGNGDGWW